MRILVVTSTFPRWYADTDPSFVFDLCKYLHEKGITVDVLAPHADGAAKHEILEDISVYRYQYFFRKYQSLAYSGGIMANIKNNPLRYFLVPFFIIFQVTSLYNRLRKTDYDLIHTHWLIPQGFITAIVKTFSINKKLNLVCTSHGGDLYALDNHLFRTLKKWAINKCDDFCVVSNAMKQKVTSLGVSDKVIHVMPMGVDFDKLFRPIQGVNRIDHQLIYVGRLVEKKGVDILIRAFADVKRKIPDSNLLIVGDGPMRPELEAIMKKLKLESNIKFLGSVRHKELPKLFSSASTAVVPSVIAASGDQEGLGLVSLEALGCGCAVIASSLDAIRDVIDVETGVLVSPGSVEELSHAIIDLLHNDEKRLKLAARGQENARQQYSWEISGQRYLKLFLNHKQKNELG